MTAIASDVVLDTAVGPHGGNPGSGLAAPMGTYNGGGMGASTPEKHDRWSMLAAIVQAPGPPYVFKFLGRSSTADGA
jgi:hypothetical protein